jgi:hypothetical protein
MKTWITGKEVLIGIMIGQLIIIAAAFWFSDGICFYRGSMYSYCAVKSVPESMAAFKKAMPETGK